MSRTWYQMKEEEKVKAKSKESQQRRKKQPKGPKTDRTPCGACGVMFCDNSRAKIGLNVLGAKLGTIMLAKGYVRNRILHFCITCDNESD